MNQPRTEFDAIVKSRLGWFARKLSFGPQLRHLWLGLDEHNEGGHLLDLLVADWLIEGGKAVTLLALTSRGVWFVAPGDAGKVHIIDGAKILLSSNDGANGVLRIEIATSLTEPTNVETSRLQYSGADDEAAAARIAALINGLTVAKLWGNETEICEFIADPTGYLERRMSRS